MEVTVLLFDIGDSLRRGITGAPTIAWVWLRRSSVERSQALLDGLDVCHERIVKWSLNL
jgi:hypothetical protein